MTIRDEHPTSPDLDELGHTMTLTSGLLQYVATVAARAPSVHNTQPWRFVGAPHGIDVYADRSRQLPIIDPDMRQLQISSGAAVHHAELALHGIGRATEVVLRPDSRDTDLLARIMSSPSPDHPCLQDWALLQATVDRHTHRFPFLPGRLPKHLLVELLHVAEAHGAHARLIEVAGERRALAAIITQATRQQEADPGYRQEIGVWAARGSSATDGVPLSAAAPLRQDEFRQRDFSLGGTRVWSPDTDPEQPDLVLLWTESDGPAAWLRTGQALSGLLLAATCAGVGASPLNQPIEFPSLRAALSRELRLPGHPQMLLRLGFAVETTPTGRRSVDEVLDVDLPGAEG